MREAREGEINILEMDPATLSSMIHYIYTLELAGDWQDLNILDVVRAADMYDLPGWLELFWSKLRTGDITLSEEKMAEIRLAEDTYDIFSYWRKRVSFLIAGLVVGEEGSPCTAVSYHSIITQSVEPTVELILTSNI